MPAILATPVYAIPVLLGLSGDPSMPRPPSDAPTRTEIVGTALSKIAASLAIALSVALVYLALLRLTTGSGALWITLAYAFATSTWSVSSQGLWQASMSQALLAGAFLALLVAQFRSERAMTVLAGALLALSVTCRQPTVIFAALLAVYVFWHHRRHVVVFAIIPMTLAGLLLTYNLYYFGTLIGAYAESPGGFLLSWPQISRALSGLLVSPNRGLLVFSPVVLPAFAGIVACFRNQGQPLLRYLALGVLLTIAFYSCYTEWDAGFSFSYRYLVDLLPAFALLVAPMWAWICARRWRVWSLAGLAVFSLGIQMVGAFYYPCGWFQSTRRDPSASARMFDWSNLELVQCLRAGPVYPDGLRAIRDLRARR